MENINCPKCNALVTRGGYKSWQIVVAICFFPLGLIALDADKKLTNCHICGHTWQA